LQFFEQHIAQLLWRADVELVPDIAPDRLLEIGDAARKSRDNSASAARSTLMPASSIAATAGTSGRSIVS